MLTRNTLLGNDDIGLECDNGIADVLHLFLLDLENAVPVVLLGDLNVGLRLALLVLERAVEQENAGVLDPPPHLGVGDILVDHDTIDNLGVLNLTTGDLLNTRVTLDIHLLLSTTNIKGDCTDGIQCQTAHEVRPPGDKLGSDGGLDQVVHGLVIVDIDRGGDFLDNGEGIGESALEGRDNDDGVDVTFELREGLGKYFTGYDVISIFFLGVAST
jgi:hypothetical protein